MNGYKRFEHNLAHINGDHCCTFEGSTQVCIVGGYFPHADGVQKWMGASSSTKNILMSLMKMNLGYWEDDDQSININNVYMVFSLNHLELKEINK